MSFTTLFLMLMTMALAALPQQQAITNDGGLTTTPETGGLIFPQSADDDQDGVPNESEAYYGSDPSKRDTDGDGYDDATEIQNGYNPNGPGKLK